MSDPDPVELLRELANRIARVSSRRTSTIQWSPRAK